MDRRAAHPRAARQDARRLVARSTATSTIAGSATTMTAGRSAATAAGAMRTCCPTSSGSSAASGRATTTFRGREGWLTVTDIDQHHPLCEAFIAGAVELGHPAQPRLQRREPARHQLRAAHDPERPAHEHGARLPASGDAAAESRRAHARACHRSDLRGQARGRRALPQGRARTARRWRCARGAK